MHSAVTGAAVLRRVRAAVAWQCAGMFPYHAGVEGGLRPGRKFPPRPKPGEKKKKKKKNIGS